MRDAIQEEPTESAQKAAVDQSLFREVNERVEEINAGSVRVAPLSDFVCECANPECTERLVLTMGEYESIRADGRRFVVCPGHVFPELERVAEKNARYWVVEKTVGARLAETLDPRAQRSDL